MEKLIQLDKDLFLFFNEMHEPWLDPVMLNVSQTIFWVPLYLLLLFVVLKEFRNDSWAPLIGIFVTILIADQANTAILKPLFERLRPSRDPSLEGLVHIVNGYRGGLYGFASSHASNTFGTTVYFLMLFPKNRKWMYFLFIWCAIVSYSRIYLGVHYPGDIIGGFAVGGVAAFAGFKTYQYLKRFTKKGKPLRSAT